MYDILHDTSKLIANTTAVASSFPCISFMNAVPHSDINVAVQFEFFQTSEGVQGGDVLHLVVREVEGAQAGKGQAPGQCLKTVPTQIPGLQRPEAGQQLHREVFTFQPEPRETEASRTTQEVSS